MHNREAYAASDAPDANSLGARLRTRRRALGKTMQQIAEEAGLTVGFVSQVERDLSAPSLTSMVNIARALEASVEMFLPRPARTHTAATHAGARPMFEGSGGARYYEFLERGFPEAQLNACISHIPVGHASETTRHEGEDFIYLVSGRMRYEVDGESYELGPGDTLHFDSRLPHRGTNIGAETAIELWVGTMRLFAE